MFTKNMSNSFGNWMEKIIYEWMHVCMIMLKNGENMVTLSP